MAKKKPVIVYHEETETPARKVNVRAEYSEIRFSPEGCIIKPKPKRGGKRPGAGRKPDPATTPKVVYSVRVSPETKAGLMHLGARWLEAVVEAALALEQEDGA